MVTSFIHIIKATSADAELIADLSTVTFIQTYRGTCPDEDLLEFLEECFTANGILNELQDPTDHYFIAYLKDSPVGYMRLKENYFNNKTMEKQRGLELKRIYVLKENHSQKMGSKLMMHAIMFASEKGFEALWLGVWEENTQAIEFYKRFGFEDTRQNQTFYIGKTAQTDRRMVKKL